MNNKHGQNAAKDKEAALQASASNDNAGLGTKATTKIPNNKRK